LHLTTFFLNRKRGKNKKNVKNVKKRDLNKKRKNACYIYGSVIKRSMGNNCRPLVELHRSHHLEELCWRTVLFLCLSSETSSNIFFSHRTSTPSAFEVIYRNALYKLLTYLLTYLLTHKPRYHSDKRALTWTQRKWWTQRRGRRC